MNYMRQFINELFLKQGIEAPYYPYELYTQVAFYEKQMVIFLELEDRADEWFEERFWDEAARTAAERDDHVVPDFSFEDDKKHEREIETVTPDTNSTISNTTISI